MNKYYFSGVLHPERATLSLSNIENHSITPDGEITGKIKFNIYNNQITAILEWKNEDDIYTIRNMVKAIIDDTVNIVGFLKGYAYDTEITKIFDEDLDNSFTFGIDIPFLAERNKNMELELFSEIYKISFSPEGVFLRRCFSDLNMAIKHASDTAFYCYRALESLKQYFGFANKLESDKEQWVAFAKAIGGTKEEIEPIRKLAFPARHGLPSDISDEERKGVFATTWDLVEKYIDYQLMQIGSKGIFHPEK